MDLTINSSKVVVFGGLAKTGTTLPLTLLDGHTQLTVFPEELRFFHLSYLPYNRGAYPNFWSFYDNTPSGVTIHLIDDGVDTRPIIKHKSVNFQQLDNPFSKKYSILIENIENIFLEFMPFMLTDTWTAKKQRGIGAYHYVRDLLTNSSGWNLIFNEELARLDKEGFLYEA